MYRFSLALVLVALPLFHGCRSAQPAVLKAHEYTLVLIKTGPQSGKLSKEENQRLFAGHFSNMERLANERHLLVAGPYGKAKHDNSLRGLFVLDTGDRARATAWAETDPPTQAGVFVLEFHDLRTDAPLAALLERELERQAQRKREMESAGRGATPGEGMRSYVLLTAEHGDVARRELADLVVAKRVYLLADLDAGRALAILDAPDLAAAQELLAPVTNKLGTHTLDEVVRDGRSCAACGWLIAP
ncbi:MAG: YciI family protein [Planctomycetota bacterium]|nr:YciI family protein [Planctomycetota bacterium]